MQHQIIFPYDVTGRQAAMLVQGFTNEIKGSLYIEHYGRRVSAKSLLGILSLGIHKGDELTFFVSNEFDIDIIKNVIKNI